MRIFLTILFPKAGNCSITGRLIFPRPTLPFLSSLLQVSSPTNALPRQTPTTRHWDFSAPAHNGLCKKKISRISLGILPPFYFSSACINPKEYRADSRPIISLSFLSASSRLISPRKNLSKLGLIVGINNPLVFKHKTITYLSIKLRKTKVF